MINGLIVYHHDDQKRNEWFINKCLQELNDTHFSLLYKEESEVLPYIRQNHIDFVIFRARNYHLLEELESLGIKCFNNSLTNRVANDKYETFLLAKKSGFPCLNTTLNKRDGIDYPYVIKSVSGHGGQEVYLIKNQEDETKCVLSKHKNYIYQKYVPQSSDVRLYILNHQLIGAVKRENQDDFRSNYSLGGKVSTYQPAKEMADIALKVADLLRSDYIGVDFIIDNANYYLNEIEDPVGAKMLYQTSKIDAISLFINDIKKKLLS